MVAYAPESPLEPSAADRVWQSLRDDILSLRLRPGDFLQERQIADSAGVSRTPVREALQRLQRDGLVKIVPRVGAYVVPISFDDVREIYQLRILLEPAAVLWAASKLDPIRLKEMQSQLLQLSSSGLTSSQRERLREIDFEFHDMIHAASSNTRLHAFVRILNDQGLRVRYLALDHHPDHSRNDILRMIDALLAGDPQLASQAMRDHILWSVRYLQDLVPGDMAAYQPVV